MKNIIQQKINHLNTLLESITNPVQIDVYIGGTNYTQINLNTGELLYYRYATNEYCESIEEGNCNITDLSDSTQIEILFNIDTNQLITK